MVLRHIKGYNTSKHYEAITSKIFTENFRVQKIWTNSQIFSLLNAFTVTLE